MQFFKERKPIVVFAAIGMLAFLLVMGTAWVQAAGDAPGADAPEAVANTAFTYQGRLDKSGSGVSGTCSFQFSLYDAAAAGSQVGSTITKNSVTVSNGLFTTVLDFGANAFPGDDRYLQIAVKCGSDSSYTTLAGRVKLNPAPYASNLKPGATVSGSDTSGRILGAINNATTGTGAAIFGEAKADNAAGVSGWSTASSGGYAVYGRNTANSGTPYGVYGFASNTGSPTSYGVYGKSNSSSGTGVGGVAPKTGVYGESTATSGTVWGVYGKSNSSSGYGVYSEGNAHINGKLTWKPITSYLSISAAAFSPQYNYSDKVYNAGSIVRVLDTSPHTYLNAPVQLPHGAVVTKMTVYWRDDYSGGNGTITLRRAALGSMLPIEVASITTNGDSGNGNTADSSINNGTIDNTKYNYYLSADLPFESGGSSYVGVYGVVIEYTINTPY